MTDDPRAASTLRRLSTAAGLVALACGWLGFGAGASAQGPPPDASGESVSVELAAPMAILVDLLANDSSPRGEPLRAVIVAGEEPEVGTLTPQWDGSFVYRVEAGADLGGRTRVTAKYRVEDSSGNASDPVALCIGSCIQNITGRARSDFFTVELDHTNSLPVLDNDEGDGLELLSCDVTSTTTGTVQAQQDGTCLYTALQVGTDTFDYTIADVYGNTDTGDVTVTVTDPDTKVVGVIRRLDGLTHVATPVGFGTSFDNPVVIAQPITMNGGNDAVLEITDVTSTGFMARVANTPPTPDPDQHGMPEEATFLVVEGGSWEISPGVWLDAGVFETDVTFFGPLDYSRSSPARVFLPEIYPPGVVPLVLTQLQTNRAGEWSQPRLVSRSEDRFEVVLQRGELDQEARDPHPVKERVGWVALTKGSGTWSGRSYTAQEVFCPGGALPVFCDVAFPFSFQAAPNLLAQIESLTDPEPAFLRHRFLTADGVQLHVRETYANDDFDPGEDGGHGDEVLGYLAVAGDGDLSATPVNKPPTAHDQTVEVAQDEATAFAPAGSDPEGDPLLFSTWELEGPGSLSLFAGTTLALQYSPPLGFSGTVFARYTVRDQFGQGLSSHNIGVATIHVRPLVASIAPPVCNGATCTFDAGPSSPEAVSYDWVIRNGVTGETATPSGKVVTHTFSSGGFHTATLTVTNAAGSQDTDVRAVSIAPTADFTASCTPERVCSFAPTGSSADALSFTWQFGDGTSSTDEFPTHVYAAGGRYLVILTVRNGIGFEDSAIQVLDLPPTAAFTVACEGRSCSFTPTGTSADAQSFTWDFGDGTSSTEPSPTHVYSAGGRYTVRLTVTNAVSLEDTAVQTLDLPPTAAFTVACDRALCSFDAAGSSADAEELRWDFGDSATATGELVEHRYSVVEGTFTARLTVENAVGLTDSTVRTVEIPLPGDLFLLLYVFD